MIHNLAWFAIGATTTLATMTGAGAAILARRTRTRRRRTTPTLPPLDLTRYKA